MIRKNSWLTIALLLVLVICIHLVSSNSVWVERYYSNGIYPYISDVLKTGLGWLPVSVGDILYGALGVWAMYKIVKLVQSVTRREITKRSFTRGFQKMLTAVLLVYIIFNVLWGINYNRQGITAQLGIELKKYSVPELKQLDSLLVLKVNESKAVSARNQKTPPSKAEIFDQAEKAYHNIQNKYPFLEYSQASVKTSLWGWLGNYLGFIGYYNPLTGEAQVNTTVPVFLQPFTTCHEMAHQLGYAKENEANFVGYLAGTASTDTFFHYSVYLDLFLYSNNNLFKADSSSSKAFALQLSPAVKADLKLWREFNRRHKNPVEPVIRWMYGKYLEGNQQPSGVLSYDEVTGFLIAYYKKYGKI